MRRTGYFRSAFLGLGASAVLIVSVAAWQLGPLRLKELAAEKLDEWHILGPRTHFLREARRLERADPGQDAKRAAELGDRRLLGFSLALGGPVELPGVKSSVREEKGKRLGVHVLFVGCDQSSEFERFHSAVARYAEKYNGDLLRVVSQ